MAYQRKKNLLRFAEIYFLSKLVLSPSIVDKIGYTARMRMHEAKIDLNECRGNSFVNLMREQFGRTKLWLSFTIVNWEDNPPEPDAGFPFGWCEVTDVKLNSLAVFNPEVDDYVTVELTTLPQTVRDELTFWALDVCDNNPDWVEMLNDRYGTPNYEERE